MVTADTFQVPGVNGFMFQLIRLLKTDVYTKSEQGRGIHDLYLVSHCFIKVRAHLSVRQEHS